MRIVSFKDMIDGSSGDSHRIKDIDQFLIDVVPTGNYLMKYDECINSFKVARACYNMFSSDKKYCLFHERGIWPSDENMYLFESLFMRAFGTRRSLRSDVYEFGNGDNGAGISFLQMALSLGWGGLLFIELDSWFYFSHDSWGILATTNAPARYLIDKFNVQIIDILQRNKCVFSEK